MDINSLSTKPYAMIRFLRPFLLVLILFPLYSCDSEKSINDGTGAYGFNIIWKGLHEDGSVRKESTLADCGDIVTVEAFMYDSSNVGLRNNSWSCSAHEGILDRIPAGSGRKIVILGKNATGKVAYWGSQDNIEIIAGQQTVSPTPIVAEQFTVSISSLPYHPNSLSNQTIEWGQANGAVEYGIIISTTNNLMNPVIDIQTATTTYSPQGLQDEILYYVQITPIDTVGNEGIGSSIRAFAYSSVKQFGTSNDDRGFGITTDSSGNFFITGFTEGNLNGKTNSGCSDAFILKLNNSGDEVWTTLLGSTACDYGRAVGKDSNGNIFITGYSPSDFAGSVNSDGNHDIFIAKYSSTGSIASLQLLSTSGMDYSSAIAIDSTGNSYISGHTDGNTGNNGSDDALINKSNANLDGEWMEIIRTDQTDRAYGICMDSAGNILVAGDTNGNLDENINQGGYDAFISKFNSSGDKLWTKILGSPAGDFANGVATDSNNNVYITGYSEGNLDGNINSGSNDVFVAKYSSAGVKYWVTLFGSNQDDGGNAIAVDSDANVYVTGHTSGDIDGNAGYGQIDIFIAKLDTTGNVSWIKTLGTSADEVGDDITLGNDGFIGVTGYTSSSLASGVQNIGGQDIFFWRVYGR